MDGWSLNLDKQFTCKNPIFIEGLPGIGNVGKIAVDYLIEKLDAKKIGSFFSYDLPHNVFVNEQNLIDLPTIDLFYYRKKNQDFLFLTGDAQPAKERASYLLTESILSMLATYGKPKIITLGGIGLDELPSEKQIFITGNDAAFIKTFSLANNDIYGKVGPIFGITGLLLGLAKNIPAVALLVETLATPLHIGLIEAKEILLLLNKQYGFALDFKDLNEEIALLDSGLPEESAKQQSKHITKLKKYRDLNYIG